MHSFQVLETTLCATPKAPSTPFKELGRANVDNVSDGVWRNVGSEAEIAYITKGTAKCSLKIMVECSFPSEPLVQPHPPNIAADNLKGVLLCFQ